MTFQLLIFAVGSDDIISGNSSKTLILGGLVLISTIIFNASINPTIYFITNRQYRRAFTAAMRSTLSTCTKTNTNHDLCGQNGPKVIS